jgi:DNA-binding NtrC family response regulator
MPGQMTIVAHSLEAIRISNPPALRIERQALTRPLLRALSLARARGPAVFLVRADEVEELRKTGSFMDCGRKPAKVELARLLLGKQRVPLIAADYRIQGRLIGGVRKLLQRAEMRSDSNVFVIGVDPRLFRQVWSEAREPHDANAPSGRRRTGPNSSTSRPALLDQLRLLPVPEKLRAAFIGSSPDAELVRQLILRAARGSFPVLILGETGTGKEIVARQIHQLSGRGGAFMPVNCGAISPELLESELFGSMRGGHSLALERRRGWWEMADGGTLFLDEIADLQLDHQVKILRALQQGEILPIGSESVVKVNVRILAATNRAVFSMVQSGRFRDDLYYRLRSFMIPTPALRDHPEDGALLARAFWKEITKDAAASLPDDVVAQLCACAWPGNGRELKQLLQHLHGLFERDIGPVQLRAVLDFEGRVMAVAAEDARGEDLNRHRVDCLHHIRRVDEVVRACRVAVRPLIDEARDDAATRNAVIDELQRLLTEIDHLSRRTLPFYTLSAFEVVDALRGALQVFCQALAEDSDRALSLWRDGVEGPLRDATAGLFSARKQILQAS